MGSSNFYLKGTLMVCRNVDAFYLLSWFVLFLFSFFLLLTTKLEHPQLMYAIT